MLQALVDEAIANGVSTQFVQGVGSAGSLICEFARQVEADLIILGRHGYSSLNEFFLGSVSHYVLHHAPCSVLVIHCHARLLRASSHHTEVTLSDKYQGSFPLDQGLSLTQS
ncbi:universal stress protein [Pantanalinema rosaneae CENA516]|uniref:universal stress protein n=1 Tax=Pantanalinema rosaneae TaxID=1620701 RepID=UPI003D701415